MSAVSRRLTFPVVLGGLAVLAVSLYWPARFNEYLGGLSLLFVALAIAVQGAQRRSARVTVEGELVVITLALLIGGPGVGALTGAVSTAVRHRRRRSGVRQTLFAVGRVLLGVGAFSAVYLLFVGREIGMAAPTRILGGDWVLGIRYLLAAVAGSAALGFLSALREPGAEQADGAEGARGGRRVAIGLVVVLPAVLAVTFTTAAFGTLALISLIPSAAVAWGVFMLIHSRRAAVTVSIALRLTAFFTAAVGTVFLILSLVVIDTFTAATVGPSSPGSRSLARAPPLAWRRWSGGASRSG